MSPSPGIETGGVAYLAHVGGFIFGAVAARPFENQRRLVERWRLA